MTNFNFPGVFYDTKYWSVQNFQKMVGKYKEDKVNKKLKVTTKITKITLTSKN